MKVLIEIIHHSKIEYDHFSFEMERPIINGKLAETEDFLDYLQSGIFMGSIKEIAQLGKNLDMGTDVIKLDGYWWKSKGYLGWEKV